jgi:hypothetical protein
MRLAGHAVYGLARSSLDADLVADLRPEHIQLLVQSPQADFYIDDSGLYRDTIRGMMIPSANLQNPLAGHN